MCFEVFGTLLGILVFTVYYTGFVQNKENGCDEGERLPDIQKRRAYLYHGLTVGVLLLVFIVITFFGVREQKGDLYYVILLIYYVILTLYY